MKLINNICFMFIIYVLCCLLTGSGKNVKNYVAKYILKATTMYIY